MKALRIAIAEDEPMNLRRLARLLEDCGCEIAATFGNGLEMEEWLRSSPDVDAVFLDIQMPGLDGLNLRASVPERYPVVFVTAFAEHAAEAFDLDAVDYLLKPVTVPRLAKALARVRKALRGPEGSTSAAAQNRKPRYPVTAGGGVLLLELARTTHFEVEEQVVWAYAGEKFRTKWKSLGEVEAAFPEAGLLRIHRHLLIRPEAVIGVWSSGNGARVMVRLLGGAEVEASRGATPRLKERLGLE
ncbi:MAG: response regulator transcription factor [Holophagaceae bacterium]|nr:response regulator transcription factor [Holophagaceae bacterium]